jgi:hypothetical protein
MCQVAPSCDDRQTTPHYSERLAEKINVNPQNTSPGANQRRDIPRLAIVHHPRTSRIDRGVSGNTTFTMQTQIHADYLSTGANRQAAGADWNSAGLVAFGADANIALWSPSVSRALRGMSLGRC